MADKSEAPQTDKSPDENKGSKEAKDNAEKRTAEKPNPAPKTSSASGKATNKVSIGGQIDIFIDQPLPQYDRGTIKAYGAVVTKRPDQKLYALICDSALIPRFDDVEKYKSIINPSLAKLVFNGTAFWTPDGQERYVFIYMETGEKPLVAPGSNDSPGLHQDFILKAIIPPLMDVMRDMRDKDFIHGSIRADNIYVGDAGGASLTLGDTLSSPPLSDQPNVYLTVENAMADRIGRGRPTLVDDMYALGVTIATLMRNNDPLEGLGAEEIVKQKILYGSYSAVTGKERFTGSILELLRGLLHDDPTQRWTLDEVLMWLEGRRLSPKQSSKPVKAQRPIIFGTKKYENPAILAMDLVKNPTETERVVDSNELEQWLKRSLEDKDLLIQYETSLKTSIEKGRGVDYPDRLVTNLSSALDPRSPVYYGGLKILPDGFGNAMFHTMVTKGDIKPYIKLLSSSAVLNWIGSRIVTHVDYGSYVVKFDKCRGFLRQSKIGYGIERCLYFMADKAQCLSETLKEYYVRTPEDMLAAFENLAQRKKIGTLFLDRHSAAFLMERESVVIESSLFDLDSIAEHEKLMGNLRTLAIIQTRTPKKKFPNVASVFMKSQHKLLRGFKDNHAKEELSKKLEKLADNGDLKGMAGLLDNPQRVKEDKIGYKKAVVEHKQLQNEFDNLTLRLENRDNFAIGTARDVTSIIACILAVIVIIMISALTLTGGSLVS